jgi:predicted O-methyltransferase YrrM
MIKRILGSPFITKTLDILLSPLTLIAAVWLKYCGRITFKPNSMPVADAILMKVGVWPVADHYYHPLINPKKHITKSLRENRPLPGVDWNLQEQLHLLSQFNYNDELLAIPQQKTAQIEYYFQNKTYLTGDAEYLYNIIRLKKPARIIEIGSGFSTLMAKKALDTNKSLTPGYTCKHICIEPYEMPWLEQTGVEVIRKRVEEIPISFFQQLEENDILFIDSSHIIRPQGDVLYEYLEILPSLNSGVIIHVHDIFSPKDYLNDWIHSHILWNEQYLLEAYLSGSKDVKIIGSLNYLFHNHSKEFIATCPILARDTAREPGAFWMQKL